MIEYLEVRDKQMELIGIVDTAKSIIWKSVYYGVGEFEVYASSIYESILKPEYYVTIPDNKEVGIIEHIEINENASDGRMIVASGRFLKSILDRRIIFKKTYVEGEGLNYIRKIEPYILGGNVEKAIRYMIQKMAGDLAEDERRIPSFVFNNEDLSHIDKDIVVIDENGEIQATKQVTYENLLTYSDEVLKEYELGSYMYFNKETEEFRYKIYQGHDLTIDNAYVREPVIFSKEYDNLVSSSYSFDSTNLKTCAYIGGEGEGTERKFSYITDYQRGLNRREIFLDGSSIASTYKNENEVEQSYTIEEYRKMLESEAKQQLTNYKIQETLDGDIDLTNSNLVYGVDYNLGDLITINDNGKYINARILAITEVIDDDGYRIDLEYGI